MTQPARQPRVRGNDWTTLDVSTLGAWAPTRSVSVVIPAYAAQRTLPYTLASLAAQSYPEHLFEVVVVDDGSAPPLTLPDLAPKQTRLVTAREGCGRANACREGAAAADGEVIHWLDSDMVLYPEAVEAQMRWHHLIDYAVVLGQKTFVDVGDDLPDAESVFDAVQSGQAETLFEGRATSLHEWVEDAYRRTRDLADASPGGAFRVHVGATASVDRGLYEQAGGMDAELRLGEDIELGYRLALQGGVFIPDREARSWHLGSTTVKRRGDEVNRYNEPFLADRVSHLRYLRPAKGRVYRVPYVEAVVDAAGHSADDVVASVNGVLASGMSDVQCLLVGPWSNLPAAPRDVLDDPDLDLRLLVAAFEHEPRVTLVEEVQETAFPAVFRLTVPAGWVPSPPVLGRLTREMEETHHGLRQILMPDGRVARLKRTSALNRTSRVRGEGEDADDVLDEMFGSWWHDGLELGFRTAAEAAEPELSGAERRAPARPAAASREDRGVEARERVSLSRRLRAWGSMLRRGR